jgi:hypothetical protein
VAELYGTEVSPDLISRVTDAVDDEVREWQNRPLDPVYPVVFFDVMRVKIRDEGLVIFVASCAGTIKEGRTRLIGEIPPGGGAGMDLDTIMDGADRFATYVEELTSVIGHAARAAPLR